MSLLLPNLSCIFLGLAIKIPRYTSWETSLPHFVLILLKPLYCLLITEEDRSFLQTFAFRCDFQSFLVLWTVSWEIPNNIKQTIWGILLPQHAKVHHEFPKFIWQLPTENWHMSSSIRIKSLATAVADWHCNLNRAADKKAEWGTLCFVKTGPLDRLYFRKNYNESRFFHTLKSTKIINGDTRSL